MELVLSGFIAGILTILAPCILPLLPVIIVGGAGEGTSRRRALTIIASLLVSFFGFTVLIRGTTAVLGINPEVWQWMSGVVLIVIGLSYLLPTFWELAAAKLKINQSSNKLLGKAMSDKGSLGPVLIGASLGPVFVSCSPTYLIILSQIQSGSWAEGLAGLLSYLLGLCLVLLGIVFGSSHIRGLAAKAADPRGWFKRISGLIFLVMGIVIITGSYKDIEIWVLDSGYYDPIARLEETVAKPLNAALILIVLAAAGAAIYYRAKRKK